METEELYERTIKALPTAERLRLAALILNDIPPQSMVDYREEWSEEDYHAFSVATWQHVQAAVGEEQSG